MHRYDEKTDSFGIDAVYDENLDVFYSFEIRERELDDYQKGLLSSMGLNWEEATVVLKHDGNEIEFRPEIDGSACIRMISPSGKGTSESRPMAPIELSRLEPGKSVISRLLKVSPYLNDFYQDNRVDFGIDNQ